MIRVVVDREICQDHGQCVFAAPDVFSMDDDGHLAYVAGGASLVRIPLARPGCSSAW